ncbi:hypothetical protein PLUTE_a6005 [Pseudoalteromonas luteoviolacea DSM 6061]|nr:hypothetical protein [Pseudoalteromonas luteoviolacea DSM 6061]
MSSLALNFKIEMLPITLFINNVYFPFLIGAQ